MAQSNRHHTANIGKGNRSLDKLTWRLMFLLSIVSIICFVTTASKAESLGLPSHRFKRDAVQLCSVVTRYTRLPCALYLSYGCYCGPGTKSTGKPVDEADTCCSQHDICYRNLSSVCTDIERPQIVTYEYDCQNCNCTCTDSPTEKACAYNNCRCDVKLGECLRNTTFSPKYILFDRSGCNISLTG